MAEAWKINKLPSLVDKVFKQNNASKHITPHKVEETIDKGTSCQYEDVEVAGMSKRDSGEHSKSEDY